MRIPYHPAHTRKRRQFCRRALRVTSCNQDFTVGVLAVNSADCGSHILVGGGGHGAGIEDYNFSVKRNIGTLETPLQKLVFDGGAICLRGAAAEVFHIKS